MELNLTTIILEIINFLILVWILKRLFYAPIKSAIEARRNEIKKSLDEAERAKTAADSLRLQVEGRLKEWTRERDAKLEDLRRELDQERERLLKNLHQEMSKETDRIKAQELAAEKETKAKQEQEAISQSLTFLSKLLLEIASPEVQSAILRSFERRVISDEINRTNMGTASALAIHSAFPISEDEKTALIESLKAFWAGAIPQAAFSLDPSLIAGIEILAGATVLRANLRDELSFFSKAVSNGG